MSDEQPRILEGYDAASDDDENEGAYESYSAMSDYSLYSTYSINTAVEESDAATETPRAVSNETVMADPVDSEKESWSDELKDGGNFGSFEDALLEAESVSKEIQDKLIAQRDKFQIGKHKNPFSAKELGSYAGLGYAEPPPLHKGLSDIGAPDMERPTSTFGVSKVTLPDLKQGNVTLKRSSIENWNELWQSVIEIAGRSIDDQILLAEQVSILSSEFEEEVRETVKIIITEKMIPDAKKSIKPVDVGGVAGGTKYIHNGIFYKFALDDQKIYGSDENAMKAAAHEYKGSQALFNIASRNLQEKDDVTQLRVPLMASVDYLGYRVTAMSKVPVNKSTLVYGSDNACETMHNSNARLYKKMAKVCEVLNLKRHVIGTTPDNRIMIYGPGDIEGHKGLDGRLYVLDTARLFPPAVPVKGIRNAYLYRMLRPELVRSNEKPLSSDAFSPFSYLSHDPAFHANNKEVYDATQRLIDVVIPGLAKDIDFLFGDDGIECKENKTVRETLGLSQRMHSVGVNIRYLGLLRKHCKKPRARSFLLQEMLLRTLKSEIRKSLRFMTDRLASQASTMDVDEEETPAPTIAETPAEPPQTSLAETMQEKLNLDVVPKQADVERMSGYLVKRGKWVKSWKRRWFELSGEHTLCYYPSSQEADMKRDRGPEGATGAIELKDAILHCYPDEMYSNQPNCFGIELADKSRVFVISCQSPFLRVSWLRFLAGKTGRATDQENAILAASRKTTDVEALDPLPRPEMKVHAAPPTTVQSIDTKAFQESVGLTVSYVFNVAFTSSEKSNSFWTDRIKRVLRKKFVEGFTEAEGRPEADVREVGQVDMRCLFLDLVSVLDLTVSKRVREFQFPLPKGTYFTADDIISSGVRIRATGYVPMQQALAYFQSLKRCGPDELQPIARKAAEKFEEALRLDPFNVNAATNYGAILQYYLGDSQRALKMYELAVTISPSNADALGNMATFHWLFTCRHDLALKYFERAYEVDPSHGSNVLNFQLFLATLKNFEHPMMKVKYFRISMNDPMSIGNYAAVLSNVHHKYDEAEKYYLHAIRLNDKMDIPLANYALFLYTYREDYTKAREYFEKALQNNPNSVDARLMYGSMLYLKLQDFEHAERLLKEAVDIQPNGIRTLYSYASFLYHGKKDHAAAIPAMQAVIAQSPTHSEATTLLLTMYKAQPQLYPAQLHFDVVDNYMKHMGDGVPDQHILQHRAIVTEQIAQQPAEAEAWHMRAYEINKRVGNDSNVALNIGNYYTRCGNFPKAVQYYNEAVADQKNAQARINFARLCRSPHLNQPQQALQLYMSSLAILPSVEVLDEMCGWLFMISQANDPTGSQAKQLYLNSIETVKGTPIEFEYRLGLARFLGTQLKAFDECLPMLQQLYQLNENHPRLLCDFGMVNLLWFHQAPPEQKPNVLDQCAALLHKALMLKPDIGNYTAYNLLCTYALMNNQEKAQQAFQLMLATREIPPKQHLQTDDDLKNIQNQPWFVQFLNMLP